MSEQGYGNTLIPVLAESANIDMHFILNHYSKRGRGKNTNDSIESAAWAGIRAALDYLQREVGSLFNDSSEENLSTSFTIEPPIDISESSEFYIVTTELPGAREVRLELDAETMTIIARKPNITVADSEGVSHRSERRYGGFRRVLSVPPDADVMGIEVTNADGVLTIVMPKASNRQIACSLEEEEIELFHGAISRHDQRPDSLSRNPPLEYLPVLGRPRSDSPVRR